MKSQQFLQRPKKPNRYARRFLVRRVCGDSMYPALEAGQLVFALHTKQISRGDVVVFRHEGIEKIKRVVGMEGDFVYVLGDNPRFSTDSRQFGYIKQSTIAGRVVWPKV